jgi:ubiquinone/menaquinone biosynthesis C-methylase UbiE
VEVDRLTGYILGAADNFSVHALHESTSPLIYDSIGSNYAAMRRPDPRIARLLHAALQGAKRVVNVGAGTGNYEPDDKVVVAVEPTTTMILQRARSQAGVVQAVAEDLPFRDQAFDAALAVFTVHHWTRQTEALAELRRVSRRQVILMRDPTVAPDFWLINDYFPDARWLRSECLAPTVARVSRTLHVRSVIPVPVPADCQDGFARAYWNRPEMFLDTGRCAAMSSISQLPEDILRRSLARLQDDVLTGRWDRRYGYLRRLRELDVGYRLVVAGR